MDNRILFLTHSLNRTGAPIALLSLIKWLSCNSGYSIDLLYIYEGPLKNEYAKYCKSIYQYNSKSFTLKVIEKLLPKKISEQIKQWYIKQKIKHKSYSLIYANSIALNKLIKLIPNNIPLITQIGELAYTFNAYNINKESLIIIRTNRFIAINEVVKNYLTIDLNVDEDKIDIITTFSETERTESKRELSKQILVGASGTVEWRKGSDLFIQLATVYKKQYPDENVKFIWVGAFSNPLIKYEIEHDLRKTGLTEFVEFVGNTNSPDQYFSKLDVFVMLSREEALGLVCIENMRYGTPVICFEKVGGMDFFAKTGAVKAVSYLDINAVSESIHEILTNGQHRLELTENAYKAINKYFNIDNIGEAYINCFESQIFKQRR